MAIALEIIDLEVEIDNKNILNGLSISIKEGEIAAIMGPNGAGKSTLASVLAGKEGYIIKGGSVKYLGKDLLKMSIEERAASGLFLAFQYPVEIPGVATSVFIRTALNAQRKMRGEKVLDAAEFLKLARVKAKELQMSEEFFSRAVNLGFSGGEKKRAEIFQMSMLSPTLAILDETDSGLDIDALRVVAEGVNRLRSNKLSGLVITHYQRLLEYLVPDTVHILAAGKIVETGDKSLALELEKRGYQGIIQES